MGKCANNLLVTMELDRTRLKKSSMNSELASAMIARTLCRTVTREGKERQMAKRGQDKNAKV